MSLLRSPWLTTLGVIGAISAVVTGSAGVRAPLDPAADLALGQIDLSHNTVNFGGLEALSYPQASAIDPSGHLYVADSSNHRVLGWRNANALQDGAPADIVIGQPDAFAASCETSRAGLCSPSAVAVDSHGNLFVADTFNNRVLEYAAPFSSGLVVGQPASVVFAQGGSFLPQQIAVFPRRHDGQPGAGHFR